MNHPSSAMSAASAMIRPKLIFLSTEDVRPYDDASKVIVPLRDQVIAEDGFQLVYGLRSFGYNTNVMNISGAQKNNSLQFVVKTLSATKQWSAGTGNFLPKTETENVNTYQIKLSDANYATVDILFNAINYEIEKIIPSGWYYDARQPESPNSMLPLRLKFLIRNQNIMIITLEQMNLNVIAAYSDDTIAYETADKIIEIRIEPDPDYPALYELLFTNVKSSIPNKPISLPSYSNKQGLNPPDAISFTIDINTYYQREFDENEVDIVIDAWSNIVYNVKEIGNEDLYDTENNIFPIENYYQNQNLPYTSYQLPDIHPIYMDILSSLENSNLTKDGYARNLLTRQFVIGSSDGTNSYYQAWDQPIYYVIDASHLSSISLSFSSQGNKWNFFNLEFALELIVFEVEDDKSNPNFVEPSFAMPSDDSLTAEISRYSRSIQNPMALVGSGQSRKVAVYNDLENRRTRRRL